MYKKLLKSALILASGTVVGQAFVLAVSPIITRIYTPDEFGIFAIYAAVVYLVSAVSALRYETALPLIRVEANALCLAVTAFLLTLIVTVFCVLIVAAGNIFLDAKMSAAMWWVPAGVFSAGAYNIVMHFQLRHENHRLIAKTRVVQAMSGASMQIVAGYYGAGVNGLVVGQIIGLSGGTTRLASRKWIYSAYKGFSVRRAKIQLLRNRSFAKFGVPSALIALSNTHLMTLLMGGVFSPAAAGAYALVQRVLIAPASIVSSSIATSHLAQGRLRYGSDVIQAFLYYRIFVLCVHPLILVAAVFCHWGFEKVFGPEWGAAADVAAWTALFLGTKFIFDSSFNLTITENRQDTGLFIQCAIFLFRHAIFLISALVGSFQLSIVLFSVASALAYFFANGVLLRFEYSRRLTLGHIATAINVFAPYAIMALIIYGENLYFFRALLTVYVLIVVGQLLMLLIPRYRRAENASRKNDTD